LLSFEPAAPEKCSGQHGVSLTEFQSKAIHCLKVIESPTKRPRSIASFAHFISAARK
jgi:hypothetical protein